MTAANRGARLSTVRTGTAGRGSARTTYRRNSTRGILSTEETSNDHFGSEHGMTTFDAAAMREFASDHSDERVVAMYRMIVDLKSQLVREKYQMPIQSAALIRNTAKILFARAIVDRDIMLVAQGLALLSLAGDVDAAADEELTAYLRNVWIASIANDLSHSSS